MQCNKRQLSEVVGVSTQAITQWQKHPNFPIRAAGKRGAGNVYETADVIRWMCRREVEKLTTGSQGERLDLEAERARLAKEQADKTELGNKVLRGELVPVTEPAALLEKVIVAFRSRVLSIPTKAAPHVHGCKTLSETRDELENALYDALNELAQLDVAVLGNTAGGFDGETATETDNQPVVGQVPETQPGE